MWRSARAAPWRTLATTSSAGCTAVPVVLVPVFDRHRPARGVVAGRDREPVGAGTGLEHALLAPTVVEPEAGLEATRRPGHLGAGARAEDHERARALVAHGVDH